MTLGYTPGRRSLAKILKHTFPLEWECSYIKMDKLRLVTLRRASFRVTTSLSTNNLNALVFSATEKLGQVTVRPIKSVKDSLSTVRLSLVSSKTILYCSQLRFRLLLKTLTSLCKLRWLTGKSEVTQLLMKYKLACETEMTGKQEEPFELTAKMVSLKLLTLKMVIVLRATSSTSTQVVTS